MTLTFIGKWRFDQAGAPVRIDPANGVLSVGTGAEDPLTHFNAYGAVESFVLQGMNGNYVVWTGAAYAATKRLTDPLNRFGLIDLGAGEVAVVDLGIDGAGETKYLWNDQSGALGQTPQTTTPPATAKFVKTQITEGLEAILRQGFSSPTPDLVWVNLAGTDFTTASARPSFSLSTLDHADFSDCKFSPATTFESASAIAASFIGAQVPNCAFGDVKAAGANFSGANLSDLSANDADFTDAKFDGAVLGGRNGNLSRTRFVRASCRRAGFANIPLIADTDFTGADLTGAVFTGASVIGPLTLIDANLTDAALNNPTRVTIYPGFIVVSSKTNFTRAKLQKLDFSGYLLANIIFTGADLSGCKFDKANLTGAELSYSILDDCSFTGTVLLNGANLSNASAKNAKFPNAQLGALSSLFSIAEGQPGYQALLDGLNQNDPKKVAAVFLENGYTIAGVITITSSRFSATTWTVQATAPTLQTFTVLQQAIGGVDTLVVYTPTTPAVLSNAFLVNTTWTGANMIGVNASGASIYGISGGKLNLNSALLQDASFSNANLSNADFSSASLGGVSFDYAILSNAVFQNAKLVTSGSGTRTSFVGTNLQGANFGGATVSDVNFTNAGVSIVNPASTSIPAGVWLFNVPQEMATLITSELNAAATGQFTLARPGAETNQALGQLQKPGPVGQGVVTAFSNHGVALTADAVLSITGEGLYWQLADGATNYVIFESYDPVAFAPALGVKMGTKAYTTTADFYLPLSTEPYLRNGPVTPQVVAAFQKAGHPIAASSQVVIAQFPNTWQVINGAPGYQVYSLWLAVDSNAGLTITVRPAISNVITIFAAASVALSTSATVSVLSTKNGWGVNNGSENPYNPVINYITFNLIQANSDAPIEVYGAVMRVARLSAPGQLQYFNIAPGITTLAQTTLQSAGNVCPNGDFATTNVINGLPYPQWLRARVAPRPPRCIPDPNGNFFCPT